jgi:uncharacterized protein YutE (UPF0331/DUF86 family)
MKPEFELLQISWLACSQRIHKLKYSLSKNQALFPLALESLELITDSQEESIDALILRYSQCVTMIQDQIFKGIAFLEQEDISDKSNRDKALLMEKLGAIRSAEEFGTAALLRNKFAHHYPEVSRARLERLNLLPIEAALVIETFDAIEKFLKNKQFL